MAGNGSRGRGGGAGIPVRLLECLKVHAGYRGDLSGNFTRSLPEVTARGAGHTMALGSKTKYPTQEAQVKQAVSLSPFKRTIYCREFHVTQVSRLKMNNSAAGSTFTVLCGHHLYLVPKHLHHFTVKSHTY